MCLRWEQPLSKYCKPCLHSKCESKEKIRRAQLPDLSNQWTSEGDCKPQSVQKQRYRLAFDWPSDILLLCQTIINRGQAVGSMVICGRNHCTYCYVHTSLTISSQFFMVKVEYIRALHKILLCNKNSSIHKRMKSPHFASSGVIIDLLASFSVRIIYVLSIGSPANGAAICRTQKVRAGSRSWWAPVKSPLTGLVASLYAITISLNRLVSGGWHISLWLARDSDGLQLHILRNGRRSQQFA
jgi:hypothetical protein